MCRELTRALAALAVERGKQALVTTHNPAILDGLNLHDDNQRLFVVYRNDEGHTKVRRVRMKPDTEPKMKLSELWLRGHLGALPQGF
jgi:predicted ATPase